MGRHGRRPARLVALGGHEPARGLAGARRPRADRLRSAPRVGLSGKTAARTPPAPAGAGGGEDLRRIPAAAAGGTEAGAPVRGPDPAAARCEGERGRTDEEAGNDAEEVVFEAPRPRAAPAGRPRPTLLRIPAAGKPPRSAPHSWKLPSLQLLTRRAHQPAPGKKGPLENAERRSRAGPASNTASAVRWTASSRAGGHHLRVPAGRRRNAEQAQESARGNLHGASGPPAIRVERVRGKGVVGIEVPNESPSMVGLRGNPRVGRCSRRTQTGALPVAVGRLVDGSPLVKNLAEMPHLLIAGATGAGKSVQINTLLCSLLIRCSRTSCG